MNLPNPESIDRKSEINYLQKNKKRLPVNHLIVVLFLLMLILIGNVSSYLSGNWSWSKLAKIDNLSQIINLRQTGLKVIDTETIEQKQIYIGGHKWSAQTLKQDDNSEPISLFLSPQLELKDKPEVEWIDIKGTERWQSDSETQLNFTVSANKQKATVRAKFFRAWNQKQTFAVVQWYAFPNGGDFSASNWFWQDLKAQLRGNRIPWVAVSFKITMEPLGDLKKMRSQAEDLAKKIQIGLSKEIFQRS